VVVDVAYVITALRATDGSLTRRLGLGLLVDEDDFAVHGTGLGGSVSGVLVLLLLLLPLLLLLLLSTVAMPVLLVMLMN